MFYIIGGERLVFAYQYVTLAELTGTDNVRDRKIERDLDREREKERERERERERRETVSERERVCV